MRQHRRQPVVPIDLVEEVDAALAAVETARLALERATANHLPLAGLRAAHRDQRRAFDTADALLRRATRIARAHSHREWSLWRGRLSRLDAARQAHLFAEQDASGVLPVGSTRAVDTGMSGPDIGELQHGRSCAPGTQARYGLDHEALLTAGPPLLTTPGEERTEARRAGRPAPTATVVTLPGTPAGSAPEAA